MASFPQTVSDVPTPSFLVDIDQVKRNTQDMIDRCHVMKLRLRPHMKTHKTVQGGVLMTGGSKRRIVVSTLREAEFFAHHGFDDILYGVIFTLHQLPRLKALSLRLESFHLMADSMYGIEGLNANPLPEGKRWSVFLKVDCGDKRAGVVWDSPDTVTLARSLSQSPHITLQGVYTHDGDSYLCTNKSDIQKCGIQAAERIIAVAERLEAAGVKVETYGTGSTPTSTNPGEAQHRLTELHPGNYIFYDAMQAITIGTVPVDRIAVRVATRVIGHYQHRNQLLVDCGFLGLTRDGMGLLDGSVCIIEGHPELKFSQMTQEVGYIEPKQGDLHYEDFPIGSMLKLLPYHSCVTAAMHPVYYVHSGEKVIETWEPCRGW